MKKENRKDVNHKVILNERPAEFQNLPRKVVSQRQQQWQAWKIPVQERDDRPLLNNGNGFTLIELLVVVLIIGILAAVALPQYKMAVLKSRYTQLMAFGNAIHTAALSYHLANGTYPSRFDELSIDIPGTGDGSNRVYRDFNCKLFPDAASQSAHLICMLSLSQGVLAYSFRYSTGKQVCQASKDWTLGNKLCQNITNNRDISSALWGDGSANFPYMKVYVFK